MSSALAFLERLETDEAFRASIDAVGGQPEKLEVIRSAGFDLQPSELAEALETRYGLVLTDEQIEQVSGGGYGDFLGYSNVPGHPNYSEHGGLYDLAAELGTSVVIGAAAGAF